AAKSSSWTPLVLLVLGRVLPRHDRFHRLAEDRELLHGRVHALKRRRDRVAGEVDRLLRVELGKAREVLTGDPDPPVAALEAGEIADLAGLRVPVGAGVAEPRHRLVARGHRVPL